MEKIHIFDTEADEEKALCKVDVPIDDLLDVSEYVERWMDELPVENVCEPCKVPALRWAENRVWKLEAAVREFRAVGCQAGERCGALPEQRGAKAVGGRRVGGRSA